MPEEKKAFPPLADFDIGEALRLQSATFRAVTEMLRTKGILHPHDLVKIKELRDALAAEMPPARRGYNKPGILPPTVVRWPVGLH